MRNIGDIVTTGRAISPQAASAAVNGAAIDTRGYDNMVLSCILGAITGSPTAATVTFKAQASDASGSGYVDIPGATKDVSTANTAVEINLSTAGLSRYVRTVGTPAFTGGTSPTALIGTSYVLGNMSGNYAI